MDLQSLMNLSWHHGWCKRDMRSGGASGNKDEDKNCLQSAFLMGLLEFSSHWGIFFFFLCHNWFSFLI